MNVKVFGVDAAGYRAHDLHSTTRVWLETNCYVDLWIELLHTMHFDPVASMAFTLAMDFEGDQWTFFKQPPADLYRLYGLDVQELAVWRSVELHLAEQVQLGRVPLVEVDAFYLPDTAGISHRIEHTKTTVAIGAIDLQHRRLGYFHNAGYFELSGVDFDGLLSVAGAAMAPYTEIIKLDRIVRRSETELMTIARELTRFHLGRIPKANPFTKYRARYATDVEWLTSTDMSVFFKYAFATLRQCGAAAEMSSTFLKWMLDRGGEATSASTDFEDIAIAAKAMQFKIARMVTTGKLVDVTPLLDQMEAGWDRAMADLVRRYAA